MTERRWWVALVGAGLLLLLTLASGVLASQRMGQVAKDIRLAQEKYQTEREIVRDVHDRVYQASILVREYLLDSSPRAGENFARQFRTGDSAIQQGLNTMRQVFEPEAIPAVGKLRSEWQLYAASVLPVFLWTPRERTERAAFFLREQQRPRRQSLLVIASEVDTLIQNGYRTQYQRIDESHRQFQDYLQRVLAAALILGLITAVATALRLASLEGRSRELFAQTEAKEEELRHLSTQLIKIQEDERRALSRELHDEVGQLLTGLRMELGMLERLRQEKPRFDDHLAEAKTLAERTMRVVRDIAVGLRPSVLDLGLVPAIQWQVRHFKRRGDVVVDLACEGNLQGLPETHATCLYRVVQEGLTNCAKHSQAKHVSIFLEGRAHMVILTLRDDGIGRNEEALNLSSGIGLTIIKERVRELNGHFSMKSGPHQGTQLNVELPLS